MSLLAIGYIVVALITGYFWARAAYDPGRAYDPREIPNQHLGWALFVWVVFGMVWPIWAVLIAVHWLYDALRGRNDGPLRRALRRALTPARKP